MLKVQEEVQMKDILQKQTLSTIVMIKMTLEMSRERLLKGEYKKDKILREN